MVTHANPSSRPAPDRRSAPPVDFDVLQSLAGVIGQDKVEQFIADFITHAGGHRRRMREAIAKDDFQELYRSAHMLLAISGSLGALEVSNRCDRLQRAAEAQDGEAARAIFAEVSEAIDSALQTMADLITPCNARVKP